jgi:hypothetical protein
LAIQSQNFIVNNCTLFQQQSAQLCQYISWDIADKFNCSYKIVDPSLIKERCRDWQSAMAKALLSFIGIGVFALILMVTLINRVINHRWVSLDIASLTLKDLATYSCKITEFLEHNSHDLTIHKCQQNLQKKLQTATESWLVAYPNSGFDANTVLRVITDTSEAHGQDRRAMMDALVSGYSGRFLAYKRSRLQQSESKNHGVSLN